MRKRDPLAEARARHSSTRPATAAAAELSPVAGAPRASKAMQAVEIAEQVIADLFLDQLGDAYADVIDDGVRRTFPVRSREMRALLEREMYLRGHTLGAVAADEAMSTIDSVARSERIEREVFVRVGGSQDEIFLDLGDERWRAVRITSSGWDIVESTEVSIRFRRPATSKPIAPPVRGGHIDELRAFIRADDDAFVLVVGWLLCALRPQGPFPVLIVSGEQGSAKSTMVRLLRSLLDPNAVPLRSPQRSDRDVAVAAHNAWVLVWDNVTSLSDSMSDTLCRISTGGGFATRRLYSDRDEMVIPLARPLAITGISNVAHRDDLADRTLSIELSPISAFERMPEADLDARFASSAGRILGALLDGVAAGMRDGGTAVLGDLPRMADASLWVAACERAFGWEPGRHLCALRAAREVTLANALANDVVASRIVALVTSRDRWTGTATELLDVLRMRGTPPDFPSSPARLSNHISRIAPLLRWAGIDMHRSVGSTVMRERLITFRKSESDESSRPTRPSRPVDSPSDDPAKGNAEELDDLDELDDVSDLFF